MEQRERTEKIKWHPGFCGGIELELREYRDVLEFEPEHSLSKEPLRMDMLIIKKKTGARIENPIGEIFRKHNVIEYKSPRDELNIDSYYKTIGYACLYKGLGKTVGEISEKELTVSIFRHTYPRELFKALKNAGANVERVHDGVYKVDGIINIPTQIIVMKELEKGVHSALKILTGGADEYEVRRFVKEAREYDVPADRNNADAVLQVSVSSNMELYEQLREEKAMCKALNELMKDELDAREARGEARGEAKGIKLGEISGVSKLKEAVFALKNGVKASEVRKKYGKDICDAANELVKSFA